MTDDADSLLARVDEVRELADAVRRARLAFAASRQGSRSGYDAAFATLCRAVATHQRRRGELLRALRLDAE